MRNVYLLLLVSLLTTTLMAQEDTSKAKDLSEVVVTGQYKPQSVKNSVYQVRVITKEAIQKQGASKLQDVLNNQLNIRFSQDVATGGSDITMMGLSGQNVKILVDGLPMIGRQGTSNEININQIDVNSIERIEIVEGPMAVIYGADALAGVINIITKKAGAAKFSITARVQEETVGKEYGIQQGVHTQSIGLAFRHKGWEFGGGFGYNYFGGWKDTAVGRELVWHWKDQITANGFVGYHTGKFNIRYRVDGLDEIITNPGNFTQYQADAGDSIAFDQEYLSRRVMQQIQAAYIANNNLSFQTQASYSTYRRQVFSTVLSQATDRKSLNPDPTSQSLINFTGFTFRTTAQYKVSSLLSFQPGVDINLESGKGERLKDGNNELNDYAFFLTSEITPGKKINIRPGIRIINNSVYKAPPVIPSINTKFVLSKDFDLRLAYARGFRSPSIRELYFNFFDANHQIVGNPDLKAETSDSYTGSLTWKTISKKEISVTTTLSGFYNNVKNLIDIGASATDPNEFVYLNIAKYKTTGGTLNSRVIYKNWDVSTGLAETGRYNQLVESDKSLPKMVWSTEVNSNIGYTFSHIGLNANLFYKYTGKLPFYQVATVNGQDVISLTETSRYHWADVTLNKKVFKLFVLSAGIKNLFDVGFVNNSASGGVHTSSGARSIGYGRSYFAGLTFNWDKK